MGREELLPTAEDAGQMNEATERHLVWPRGPFVRQHSLLGSLVDNALTCVATACIDQ